MSSSAAAAAAAAATAAAAAAAAAVVMCMFNHVGQKAFFVEVARNMPAFLKLW